MHSIEVIDSHTGGEPTRVVLSGVPALGEGTLAARAQRFAGAFDDWRRAIVNEPRGSDVMVGALLLPPADPSHSAAVIFFNNVGTLGMCGHGLIGLMVTLHHLGRVGLGIHQIETPVGVVSAELLDANHVRIGNVPSYRRARDVAIEVPGLGTVRGDVAWGGNWFFLVDAAPLALTLTLDRVDALTELGWRIRCALNAQGFPEVDHVEMYAEGPTPGADARNFVLCPGKAYDRSPCGTGTSAKLACLAADGELAPDVDWVQESIVGSRFVARYSLAHTASGAPPGAILPQIAGSAWITGHARLLLDPTDPFRFGIC